VMAALSAQRVGAASLTCDSLFCNGSGKKVRGWEWVKTVLNCQHIILNAHGPCFLCIFWGCHSLHRPHHYSPSLNCLVRITRALPSISKGPLHCVFSNPDSIRDVQ
jgi:hypothetical protein